jgi:hypothetical protein
VYNVFTEIWNCRLVYVLLFILIVYYSFWFFFGCYVEVSLFSINTVITEPEGSVLPVPNFAVG